MKAYEQTLVAAGRSRNTIKQRMGDVERFARSVDDVWSCTADDVTAYFAAHPSWAAEYRKKVAISLRQFFTWGAAQGRVLGHPERGLPHVRVPRYALPPAPDDEIESALRIASPRERAVLLLGACLGLRRSEITVAHPQHRRGHVLAVTGKAGRTRHVPLDHETYRTLKYLEDTQGRDAPYFRGGSDGGHVHPATVYKWIKNLLPDWSPHSLRRRAGRTGYQRTRNIRAVQSLLGHESLETTALYVHVDEDEIASVTAATSIGRTPVSVPDSRDPIDVASVLSDVTAAVDRAAKAGIKLKFTVV